MRLIDKRFDSYFPNLIYFFENIEIFGYRYGYDYINLPLLLVPRVFLLDKPVTFVREFNDTLTLQSAGGTGGTSLIEAWINFGPFGLILNAILVSLSMFILNPF